MTDRNQELSSGMLYVDYGDRKLRVRGTENMTYDEVVCEVNRGGRFVFFHTCVSFFIITQRTPSDIHFVRSNEKIEKHHLRYTLATLLLGWWGIPWGIIWTISCVTSNIRGGMDVTQDVMSAIRSEDRIRTRENAVKNRSKHWENVNMEEFPNKLAELSDYEFKVNYWNKLDKYKPDAAELIHSENEKRKSMNPHFENYTPRDIEDEM